MRCLIHLGMFTVLLSTSALSLTTDNKDQVILDRPHGGWKVQGLTDSNDNNASTYPFNLIDRGRIKGRSLIKGQIIRRKNQQQADHIIINGSEMPLLTDSDGNFVRPYAFGKGSNSVEIKSANSRSKRVQFYDASTNKAQAKIRAILSWDDNQAEVDMHVITPDGGHAFYANPLLTNGAVIDPDGVDGPGPEIFTMATPPHGLYQIWINYWGNFSDNGYHFEENTRKKTVMTAHLTLIFAENTLAERQETFVVPLRKVGEMMLVKSFLF